MSELVAIAYEDKTSAEEARGGLLKMQREHLIDLEDAVVAVLHVKHVGLGASGEQRRRDNYYEDDCGCPDFPTNVKQVKPPGSL